MAARALPPGLDRPSALLAFLAAALLGACAGGAGRASVPESFEQRLLRVPAEARGPLEQAEASVEDARRALEGAREEARRARELREELEAASGDEPGERRAAARRLRLQRELEALAELQHAEAEARLELAEARLVRAQVQAVADLEGGGGEGAGLESAEARVLRATQALAAAETATRAVQGKVELMREHLR